MIFREKISNWRESLKKFIREYIGLFSIAGTIVLLDQLTKHIVRTNLPFGQVYRPELWLSQYVRIVHWRNTGAAFGIFQDMNMVFTVLSFIVVGVIIYYYPRVPREDWLIRLAMSLQLGGALGNLIDRLNQGYVTDFISMINFPVFNIADASISIGVAILFFALWQRERKEKELQKSSDLERNHYTPENLPSSTLNEEAQGK
jgi:signal peptidase II